MGYFILATAKPGEPGRVSGRVAHPAADAARLAVRGTQMAKERRDRGDVARLTLARLLGHEGGLTGRHR